MPRKRRSCPGGLAYHVMNRATARKHIFDDAEGSQKRGRPRKGVGDQKDRMSYSPLIQTAGTGLQVSCAVTILGGDNGMANTVTDPRGIVTLTDYGMNGQTLRVPEKGSETKKTECLIRR